jgi:hypothetical protein
VVSLSSFNTTAENNVKRFVEFACDAFGYLYFDMLNCLSFAATLYAEPSGFNWNWRCRGTAPLSQLIDAIPTFITVFDVYRNRWF